MYNKNKKDDLKKQKRQNQFFYIGFIIVSVLAVLVFAFMLWYVLNMEEIVTKQLEDGIKAILESQAAPPAAL